MVDGTSALRLIPDKPLEYELEANNFLSHYINNGLISKWNIEQYNNILNAIRKYGTTDVTTRKEYTLLKQIISSRKNDENLTEVPTFRQIGSAENPVKSRAEGSGVNSPIWRPIGGNYTYTKNKEYKKPFLAPLDVQNGGSIADNIETFKNIQSDDMSLNIGFDTEFQNLDDDTRNVLSLQMTIDVGYSLIRYFFLVHPDYQSVDKEGGHIPLKYCLADILDDLKNTDFPDFPIVRKEKLIWKTIKRNDDEYKIVDFKAMKDSVIPVCLVCHTGKADISVFRRSTYDVDILSNISEIQGGWMSTNNIHLKAENDDNYNYYWLLNLTVRDTLGLTPADNKSLQALGNLIGRAKIDLPSFCKSEMTTYAVINPINFYEYAMNDADIVVSFCSELFRCNYAIPMTLSSAAAKSMYNSIMEYFNVNTRKEYDRTFRGLEMLDEGIIPSKDECMKFLKATRYVPIRDNPDAKLVSEYFEEAYVGGFNASFFIGWITEKTTDFDLKNAYPVGMANVIDVDFTKHVRDFPRMYDLSLQDFYGLGPLTPMVAVGDFDFPDDCYCPNIPVPAIGGLNIYPRHGKNVYMCGPDMFLALRLGAKIKIFRGFVCAVQLKDDKPSRCLAYAVTNMVQDRNKAKLIYKDKPIVEKSLKTMVNSGYGKTAQNVSPKTRYNAKKQNRENNEPSIVTSPYHACYTTALVRCMLIACINQLHEMGYKVYSVTTDGFITNAPEDVVKGLDAYGFKQIFQNGRYTLNQSYDDIPENNVWEAKHYNDTFLNITTRGNVAVNDGGVLAHNSYVTGEEKDSRADRDAYIIAVLSREGKLKCSTKVWTQFSNMVEKKCGFKVSDTVRELSMNFDYKRCPIVETAYDRPVHYESVDGKYVIDTTIAEFDTRPFNDVEEFANYRKAMESEDCVKVKKTLNV